METLMEKMCQICQSKFTPTGRKQKYCRSACNSKSYRLRHPDRVKKTKRKYREGNIEKVLKQRRDWYTSDKKKRAQYRKEKMSDYHREYWRNRRESDPMFRIKNNMRNKLNAVCKGKRSSLLTLLGCSFEEFREHIQSQFVEDMSWDNYGKYGWHIDHIRPLDSFNLTDSEELKEAWNYTNLQPLWAKDNLSKGSKYE